MDPKYWWSFGVIVVDIIALLMEFFDKKEFDPGFLPPPAAGSPAKAGENRLSCEGVIYGVSQDGVRFVRESGGGTLIAAVIDDDLGFYQLGRHGNLQNLDNTRLNADASEKMEYALLNCDARYLPSGINFAYR